MANHLALETKDLWFSYEVAQNHANDETKVDVDLAEYGKKAKKSEKSTLDGGLSIENPRRQYDADKTIVYKLQLAGVNMELPVGGRCMLVGANGAGKTTLISVLGGKHKCKESAVRVLGRPAFEDTTLCAEISLLTGNWTHTVSFVGHNVPYQAMEVATLIKANAVGVDPVRVERLVKLLEVNRKWNLTEVSDGQRRRVQILCKLIKPFKVLLLDEITTDLDLMARQDLLQFLREESERGVTILYCTHIFDGLDGWGTHIAYVSKGEIVFCKPVSELTTELTVTSQQAARGWGTLFCAVQRWLLDARPDFAKLLKLTAPNVAFTPPVDVEGLPPAVKVTNFTWRYKNTQTPQLDDISFEIPRGARCILIGANGAGKTTLLKVLGGKSMVPEGAVQCLGYNAFHDLELNNLTALLSGDWTRQVACVGNGVPFQADFSVGFMAENYAEALVRDGMDKELVASRMHRLVTLLDMDLSWRLHQVSDGQRRRAQLLLKLLRPSQLLLMDEVTTDLDVISRQALLQFLREECEQRGATVVYSTHILDGLDDWPSHVLYVKGGKVCYCGEMSAAPATKTSHKLDSSGSLFTRVKSWLLSEREAAAAKALDVQCEVTPPTAAVVSAPTPPPAAPEHGALASATPAPGATSSFGSRFDRFGGSSRQNMYG